MNTAATTKRFLATAGRIGGQMQLRADRREFFRLTRAEVESIVAMAAELAAK